MPKSARLSIREFAKARQQARPLVMLSVYDAAMARLADEAGIDALLVGDSVAMTMLGHGNTLPATMDQMVHHAAAVVRGSKRATVIGDLPFMSYHAQPDEAVRNAGRLIQEAGCQAVKLEGGASFAPLVRRLVESGIPVCGHIGLQPQSVLVDGYSAKGRSEECRRRLLEDALALQDAGAFAIVLECVLPEAAAAITAELSIPTIGIGSGQGCSGQVQVMHDLLGLDPDFTPRHARRYAQLGIAIRDIFRGYAEEVRSATFSPGAAP